MASDNGMGEKESLSVLLTASVQSELAQSDLWPPIPSGSLLALMAEERNTSSVASHKARVSLTFRASGEEGQNELQISLVKVTATKASVIKRKALESPGIHLSCVLNSISFQEGESECKVLLQGEGGREGGKGGWNPTPITLPCGYYSSVNSLLECVSAGIHLKVSVR